MQIYQLTRTKDAGIASAIGFSLVLLVAVRGDPLYFGIWYYALTPAVILGLCALLQPAPGFLTGTSVAVAASMLTFMIINWVAVRPEGMLGLGHMLSLPGGVAASLGAALIARQGKMFRPLPLFVLGIAGYGAGYFINQLVVCNTLMWCGPFSMKLN
jgi:hypothetical protein